MLNFNILVSLCRWAGWFEHYVYKGRNTEKRVSCDETQIGKLSHYANFIALIDDYSMFKNKDPDHNFNESSTPLSVCTFQPHATHKPFLIR